MSELISAPPFVIVDTETDGLHRDRMPWDVAMLVSRQMDAETGRRVWIATQFFVDGIVPSEENEEALNIGKFSQRFPHDVESLQSAEDGPYVGARLTREAAAVRVADATKGAHMIGANVGFDMLTLENLLVSQDMKPRWQFRPIDVPVMAGALAQPRRVPQSLFNTARSMGVETSDLEQHSAKGDATAVLRICWALGIDEWQV